MLVALLGITPAVLAAQSNLESVLSYRTVKVADGIYAFITPEERSGFQSGNSVAIIGDDGVLVYDTGNIPSSARRQIAELRKLTDKPVRFVVNSHWHPDHNLGNAEYHSAFPSATFIGTSATRVGILERVPNYFNQMKSFAPRIHSCGSASRPARCATAATCRPTFGRCGASSRAITTSSCPRSSPRVHSRRTWSSTTASRSFSVVGR
jgi:hypothetical protein